MGGSVTHPIRAAQSAARRELEDVLDRSTDLFALGIADLAYWKFRLEIGKAQASFRRFGTLIQNTLALADLYGCRRTLREARSIASNAAFHKGDEGRLADVEIHTPLNQTLTFHEAIDDLIRREPTLAKSAEEVSRLYSVTRAFALARSTSKVVTAKVQQIIWRALQEGKGAGAAQAEQAIQELGPWTRAYASTVYRTNAATAYANGRFRQASDEQVREFVGALERRAIKDDRTRPNHLAADGLVGAPDDVIWKSLGLPAGFQ